MSKTAIIIGAGPAGLTAAYELLEQTDIIPVILEATADIGGLSKTVNYKGNRLDIGPHRFFSKSDKVMNWWQNILPISSKEENLTISYQNKQTIIHATTTPRNKDEVMLVHDRLTRIYFLGKLFNYPLKLNAETISNLGIIRIARIGFSYIKTKLFPRKPELTLEDFFINRFGKELYLTFFKDYTEKVWGTPTSEISAAWGAQRVKGLSLSKTVRHLLFPKKDKKDISQKDTETSLIEKFLYPKYGPGQMWETVARLIEERGGRILLNHEVKKISHNEDTIQSVTAHDKQTGKEVTFNGDYFISSMPVKDLLNGFSSPDPAARHIANNLIYRDFIVVGLLLKDLKLKNKDGSLVKDNWLYIQEKKVKVGRLQVYNNWGDAMLHDPENTYWMGLEYFCNEGDELWNMSDKEMIAFAKKELASINIINETDVLDAVVVRMVKTYPSYVGGAYEKFDIIRQYVDRFSNLFLIGRNGMHKYNNQDHSMLTAMQAVENIKANVTDKENIWMVNTEQDYNG